MLLLDCKGAHPRCMIFKHWYQWPTRQAHLTTQPRAAAPLAAGNRQHSTHEATPLPVQRLQETNNTHGVKPPPFRNCLLDYGKRIHNNEKQLGNPLLETQCNSGWGGGDPVLGVRTRASGATPEQWRHCDYQAPAECEVRRPFVLWWVNDIAEGPRANAPGIRQDGNPVIEFCRYLFEEHYAHYCHTQKK